MGNSNIIPSYYDNGFQIKLENALRKYCVDKNRPVYLMPSAFYWEEFGNAATNLEKIPVFVDLEMEVLNQTKRSFPSSKWIKHDVTYPLQPVPDEKIHWVLYRSPYYIFREIVVGKDKIPVPGNSLTLKSHRDYTDKLYVLDRMTKRFVDKLKTQISEWALREHPLDFEESLEALDTCGYKVLSTEPLKSQVKIFGSRRLVVAEPK